MHNLTPEQLQIHARELDVLNARYAAHPAGSNFWEQLRLRLHTRHGLMGLTPEQLKDVGLTAAQACQEARRPVWRLLLEALRLPSRQLLESVPKHAQGEQRGAQVPATGKGHVWHLGKQVKAPTLLPADSFGKQPPRQVRGIKTVA